MVEDPAAGFTDQACRGETPVAVIGLGDVPCRVGRSSKSDVRLLHPTISRAHAIIEKQNGSYLVRDLDSRYGTFVNGTRVSAKVLVEGDLIRFGTATHYRLTDGTLGYVSAAGGCSLSFSKISVVKGGKAIISDASFEIPPNAFVGILGPSGAGKSSLLSVMASYHSPEKGIVVFDGSHPLHLHLDEYRTVLGNVPQQDIVYPGLTARENLFYASRLRAAAETPVASLHHLTERVLAQVGLTDHADQLFEKLSGGQQKRVSVALELLKRPRLLLLDEPTSGLDPAAEASLMENLKVIASQGTTVVCTTHHMDNVGLFDLLVVVGVQDQVGRIAYVGEAEGFLGSFACRSYADAFERLRDGAFPAHLSKPALAINHEPVSSGPQSTFSGISEQIEKPLDDKIIQQAGIVSERSFKRIWRDKALVAAIAAQPVMLGALIAVTQSDAFDARLLHFFLCVVSIWLGLNNSARDLVRERKIYLRERLAGLSPEAYLAAKFCVFASVGLLQTIALLLVALGVLLLTESELGVLKDFYGGSWLPFSLLHILLCLYISYLCGLGLGLLASTLAKTEEAAVAMLPLLIMPQILISAVAVGCSDKPWNDSRAFKPLIMSFSDGMPAANWVGRLLDDVSLICYSRSATLALDAPRAEGFGHWTWVGDFLLLILLLIATWAVLYLVFRLKENSWPKLLGLG